MKVFFDTEFIEDGHTIELLSIGLVREDGATYYAEPAETDRSRANEWVQENVLPNLTGPVKPRAEIAADLIEFVGDAPQFWAYYADYDWVALCQLYGRMLDLPDGWPMFCRDFKQVLDELGLRMTQDDSIHHALDDARWLARSWWELEARGIIERPSETDTGANLNLVTINELIRRAKARAWDEGYAAAVHDEQMDADEPTPNSYYIEEI